MKQVKYVALGLVGIIVVFLFVELLGIGWGHLFTYLDPTHPEKFGHAINFFRGIVCTGSLIGVLFLLTWGSYSLGKFLSGLVEAWKDNR